MYEVFPGSISQEEILPTTMRMNMWWLADNINAFCDLVPDQTKQHAHPVCTWIHSIHELDKLIPWEYQEQVKGYCYPQVLSQHCYQSSLLLGSSNKSI